MQLSKFKTVEGLAASLRSIFGFGKFGIYARVYNNADITISNNTVTALTFNSEEYDTDSIHSTVTNTGRLTCVTSGWYTISGHAIFDANVTGIRRIAIMLNATTYLVWNGYGTDDTRMSVNTQYYLSADDYVDLRVYQNSGGDLDIKYYAYYTPAFMMTRIP